MHKTKNKIKKLKLKKIIISRSTHRNQILNDKHVWQWIDFSRFVCVIIDFARIKNSLFEFNAN